MPQAGLARIIVIAPNRRVELTVPEHVPLAGILPTLLRHAGPALAEDGVDHGGWLLRRIDGTPLDNAKSLAMHNVLDGETLVLAPNDTVWPEPAFDDVAEAIAEDARRLGTPWGPHASVVTGRILAAAALAAGIVALFTETPTWRLGVLALAAAVALLVAAVCFDRVARDSAATQLTGGFALLYGAAGAVLIGAEGSRLVFSPWPVAGGAAALLFVSLVGQVLLPGVSFIAGTVAATGLAAVALLVATSLATVEGAAAVVSGAVVMTVFAFPRWAMSIGGVPAPSVPTLTGEIEDPAPPPAQLSAAVRRADALLTGMLVGAAIVTVVGIVLLVRRPTVGGLLLVGALTAVCALRSRAFAGVRHRAPLIAVAVAGTLGLAWWAWTEALHGSYPTRLAVAGCLILAVLGFALFSLMIGRRVSRRAVSPRLGRLADITSFLATAAIPPLAALTLGAFGFMRGLGG